MLHANFLERSIPRCTKAWVPLEGAVKNGAVLEHRSVYATERDGGHVPVAYRCKILLSGTPTKQYF